MKQCEYCEGYKDKGHNYCRICGYHVRKGLVNHAELPVHLVQKRSIVVIAVVKRITVIVDEKIK